MMFYFSSREREENISDLHLSRLRCDQMVSVKCKMKYLIEQTPDWSVIITNQLQLRSCNQLLENKQKTIKV